MEHRARLSPAAARNMQAALAAQQRGDLAHAETLFEALTRAQPDFPDAWHFWGLLLHQRGEKEQALERLQQAQSLEPGNIVFLLNFGRVLGEQGRFPASIDCLERAHLLEPDHAQVLVLLTRSMLAVERGGELVKEIERHLGWAADSWHLWMLLGECREQGGDRPGALEAFAKAAGLAPPGEARPYLRRADAARRAHDSANVLHSLQAALRIDERSAEARAGLASLAAESGDFARAETLAREALSLNATLYQVWLLLGDVASTSAMPRLAEELEHAREQAGDDPRAWPLHFARGKVLEKIGEYDRAFGAYADGNRIRAEMRPYSRETQAAYSGGFISALDASFVARAERIGAADSNVIFVCGMPRSGTTLVETILASHPAITAGGEQRHIHDWMRRELGTVGMMQTGGWLRDLTDSRLKEIAVGWRQYLNKKAEGHRYITDKMPGNYAMLGLLHVCFPTAPIVYLRRDARDVCFSCYAMSFAEGHAFAYALESLGHYYRLHEALVAHWRNVLPPQRIIEIEYEKLVHEPEPQIRRLLEAVGLEWDPQCLNFHQARRSVATASLYQVRQPLYSTSVGRWKRFERHLGPLFTELEGPSPL